MRSGDIAEIIANKINVLADDTGVEATSSTQAMLSFENTSNNNRNNSKCCDLAPKAAT